MEPRKLPDEPEWIPPPIPSAGASSQPIPPAQASPPPIPPTMSGYSLGRSLRSAIANIAANGNAAAQIAISQVDRVAISRMTLPAAYRALGEDVHRSGRFRDEFVDLYARVDTILNTIQWLRQTQAPVPGEPQPMSKRAKATARHALDLAKVPVLAMEAKRTMRKLGKCAYEIHGESAGSVDTIQPIVQAHTDLEALDDRIKRLSELRSGDFLTPKRLLVGSGVLIALIFVFFAGRVFTGISGSPDATLRELRKLEVRYQGWGYSQRLQEVCIRYKDRGGRGA